MESVGNLRGMPYMEKLEWLDAEKTISFGMAGCGKAGVRCILEGPFFNFVVHIKNKFRYVEIENIYMLWNDRIIGSGTKFLKEKMKYSD